MGKLFTRHCDWFHLKAVTQSTQRTCILVHSSINWHSKYLPDLGGYLYGWFKVTSASSTAAFCRLNDVPIWKKIDFSTTKNYFFLYTNCTWTTIFTIDWNNRLFFCSCILLSHYLLFFLCVHCKMECLTDLYKFSFDISNIHTPFVYLCVGVRANTNVCTHPM